MTKEQWTAMCGLEGHKVSDALKKSKVLSQEDLRAARLARFTVAQPSSSNVDSASVSSSAAAAGAGPVSDSP